MTQTPLTAPPVGTYDPNLDAQVSSAQRGYGDLESDISLASGRRLSDFGISQSELDQQRQQGLSAVQRARQRAGQDFGFQREGIQQQSGRSLADLVSARGRGTEDYQRQIAGLNRSYEQLGQRQTQQTQATGGARGGALQQAMQKRQANLATDRSPVDTNYGRFMADSSQREQRLGEDTTRSLGRLDTLQGRAGEDQAAQEQQLNQGYDTQVSHLGLGLQRAGENDTIKLQRAARELGFFNQDTNANRFWQALQSGLWDGTDPRKAA